MNEQAAAHKYPVAAGRVQPPTVFCKDSISWFAVICNTFAQKYFVEG